MGKGRKKSRPYAVVCPQVFAIYIIEHNGIIHMYVPHNRLGSINFSFYDVFFASENMHDIIKIPNDFHLRLLGIHFF